MSYPKNPLSITDQIQHLKDKGLNIPDESRAARYLSNISLCRLKAYAQPFYTPDSKNFTTEVSFEDILRLYVFDRQLRVLALDALERIEIAIRTMISNTMCEKTKDPHWYLNDSHFTSEFRLDGHSKLIRNIEFCTGKLNGGKHPACDHYFNTYPEPACPPLPPSWTIAEVVTMGTWSKVYEGLRKVRYKKIIAGHFGFTHLVFEKWIHALTLLRNICAHHQRLWNRKLPPKATSVEQHTHKGIDVTSSYCNYAIIYAFLCTFTNNSTWNERFFNLVDSCPADIYRLSDFPSGWYELPFWRLS